MAKKATDTKTEAKSENKSAKLAKITAPISPVELGNLRREYVQFKQDVRLGKQKNTARARELRRNIARAMTLKPAPETK
jgi:ribosomal protein L29